MEFSWVGKVELKVRIVKKVYDITNFKWSLKVQLCLQYMKKIRAPDSWFLLELSVTTVQRRHVSPVR